MSNYVTDVETTGVKNNPELGRPSVIELAYILLPENLIELDNLLALHEKENSLLKFVSILCEMGSSRRYMPSMAIDKRATEVHGILFKDLIGEPKESELKLPEDLRVMVGHNINFDYRCLDKPAGVELLCTLSLSRAIDKHLGIGFGSHKQDRLLGHIYNKGELDFLITGHHAALEDCAKSLILLLRLRRYIKAIETVEGLIDFQTRLKKVG